MGHSVKGFSSFLSQTHGRKYYYNFFYFNHLPLSHLNLCVNNSNNNNNNKPTQKKGCSTNIWFFWDRSWMLFAFPVWFDCFELVWVSFGFGFFWGGECLFGFLPGRGKNTMVGERCVCCKNRTYEGNNHWILEKNTYMVFSFYCHSWCWLINQQCVRCFGSIKITSVSTKPSADDTSTTARLVGSSRLIA